MKKIETILGYILLSIFLYLCVVGVFYLFYSASHGPAYLWSDSTWKAFNVYTIGITLVAIPIYKLLKLDKYDD